MIKQLNLAHDYHDIFTLSQFAFQYKLSEEDLAKKRQEAEQHTIWGVMVEEKLAAKLHLIPLTVTIHGKPFEMGGISSVATWPEFRRNGMVKDLLAHALQHMKENGQLISYLHPFSVPFYRKYGWEITFNEKLYKIPFDKLKQNWNVDGYVRRIKPDIDLLNTVYRNYAKNYTGPILRDEKWWKQRVLKEDVHIAMAFHETGQPEGYIVFEVKDKLFTVIEIAYQSLKGLKLLMQFIGKHDSMAENAELVVPENDNIPLLLREPRFETKVDPYFMARVVDVQKFLEQYPFVSSTSNDTISIYVEDEFLPDNTGTYCLHQGGKVVTYESKKEAGVVCTIQQFTVMFLGYKRPLDLYHLGLIQGDIQAINELEQLIPRQQTYFPDFF
jgi:predicted acetyltransferase